MYTKVWKEHMLGRLVKEGTSMPSRVTDATSLAIDMVTYIEQQQLRNILQEKELTAEKLLLAASIL